MAREVPKRQNRRRRHIPKPLTTAKTQRLRARFNGKKDSVDHKKVILSRAVSGDIAEPLSGSKYSEGHFTGVPLGEVPASHCTWLQWIFDNYPFECVARTDWKWGHSEMSILFLDKESASVVKEFGPEIVTGRDGDGSSNFADQHMRLGMYMIRDAALWVEEQLIEDDEE